MLLFCAVTLGYDIHIIPTIDFRRDNLYEYDKLNDNSDYWLYLFPEMFTIYLFALSKHTEDCFHCFNRVNHINYSSYQYSKRKIDFIKSRTLRLT